jgi:hypothetical protein
MFIMSEFEALSTPFTAPFHGIGFNLLGQNKISCQLIFSQCLIICEISFVLDKVVFCLAIFADLNCE